MPSLIKRNSGKDLTYEAVSANLAGSVLVVPNATAVTLPGLQGIAVAGDAAKNCVGATAHFAYTAANLAAAQNTTDATGFPVTTTLPGGGPEVTVYNNFVGLLTYTAVAVAYGAKLACAANGAVRAWITADGADAIIGWCAQPGGVSSAGGLALARIDL